MAAFSVLMKPDSAAARATESVADDGDLTDWVDRGPSFARSLPPKG